MDPEYPLATNVAIHLVLSVLDLGINAAAGVAAAATGVHVNGDATTEHILRLGALGGVIKSGIVNSAALLCMITSKNIVVQLVLGFAGSSIGAALIVTSIIAVRVLGDVPNALLIAAAAAGAPLTVGTAATLASGPIFSIQAIGWDALDAYTFVRVAQNHKFHICEYASAAAAGAVFGVLVWFMKLPLSLCYKYKARQKPNQDRGEAAWYYN